MISSIYIHIPFCKTKCEYCDFFSVPCGNTEISEEYVVSLLNELEFRLKFYNIDSIFTVYIGGGTPSLLKNHQIKKIMDKIYSVGNPVEVTMEVNPDDISEELLSCMQEVGINRISCGIQSLDDEVLHCVKRRGCAQSVWESLKLIKDKWKGVFSVDLISALPNQSEQSFLSGLKKVISLQPDHVSMYALTIEESTPLGKKIESGDLVYDYEKADDIWLLGRDLLLESGYLHYEVSNFSKEGFFCKHNLVYWDLKDYIGVGSGATGTVYSNKSERWTNITNIEDYISFWSKYDSESSFVDTSSVELVEEIDLGTQIFEFFMMGLRMLKGVAYEDFVQRFNMPFPDKFLNIFNKWQKKGLSDCEKISEKTYYYLNSEGIMFLNEFLQELI